MKNRSNLRLQPIPILKPALKLQWMIHRSKHPSLSFRRRRSSMPAGCAAIFTDHEDILIEILARLPVKTLMRFRCVCKTWRSLIADPHFVKKHMKYDAERGVNDDDMRLLFSMKPPRSMGLADLKSLKDPLQELKKFWNDRVPIREVEFPVCLDFVPEVNCVGSCNGIVCVQFRSNFVLWNPCTGEHNVLPQTSGVSYYLEYYGFGYDEVNDDYKVVKGSHNVLGRNDDLQAIVQVFSMRRGTWNTYSFPLIGNYRSRTNACMRGQGSCVNGVLHWLRVEPVYTRESKEILRFSLAEEKFLEVMPIPYTSRGILIWRDRLCVHFDRSLWRIMMMEDYGVKDSWKEVLFLTYHIVPELYEEIVKQTPLWIMENGDVLACTVQQGSYLSVYKSKDRAFTNVINLGGGYEFEPIAYRETLVSPITGSLRDI